MKTTNPIATESKIRPCATVAGGMPGNGLARALLVLLLLSLTVATGDAVSSDPLSMKRATDLRQEAEMSRSRKLVILLEFSSEDCAYCRKLEKLFLLPMQRNADYDSKILVRSISLDAGNRVVDFDGRSISTAEFAARYDVSLTPTMLFLNAEGEEMSERLVGIWSEDYFGWFIDTRIDEALHRL